MLLSSAGPISPGDGCGSPDGQISVSAPPSNHPRSLRTVEPPRTSGAAFSATLLAGNPARASSVLVASDTAAGGPADPPKTLSETLRDLPVAIQGIWVGLVCIALLVVSTVALRSLFDRGAPTPVVTPTQPASNGEPTAARQPAVSAPSASATAASATASGGSLSIGGAGQASGLGGFGVLSIRDRLPTHIRLRKIGPFLDDLDRLIEVEPTALDRSDVRHMIADAATFAMVPSVAGSVPPDGERLFKFLTGRAGAAGPDILFDLVTTRGGSRAATYAEDLLTRPDVRARGTAAFNIAYDIRTAPSCQARVALLDRAGTDGDKRVLQTLFQMARCGRGPTDCCLSNDAGYKEVVRVINAKR